MVLFWYFSKSEKEIIQKIANGECLTVTFGNMPKIP